LTDGPQRDARPAENGIAATFNDPFSADELRGKFRETSRHGAHPRGWPAVERAVDRIETGRTSRR